MPAESFAAIITAAGSSTRFHNSLKKEYALLDEQPVLIWSLKAFLMARHFSPVVITVPQGHEGLVEDMLKDYKLKTKLLIRSGGRSRQESVKKALLALKDFKPNYVLIHDGARPWVSPALINSVLTQAVEHGACIPLVKQVDSVVKTHSSNQVAEYLDRDFLFSVQTPQGFLYEAILDAHLKAEQIAKEFSDDGQIYLLLKRPLFTVPGEVTNRKITYLKDLK